MSYFVQGLSSNGFRLLTAFLKNFHDIRNVFGVFFTAVSDRLQSLLENIIQEFFNFYVSKSAALIVCL